MSAVYVIKKVRFSAAHYFYLPGLSKDENRRRFGPTSNRNGHGHNYELEVTVKGPCDPETGMVINLKDLKQILQEEILEPLDFKNLNLDVPYFSDCLPTLENVSVMIWNRLQPRLDALALTLDHVRIAELDDLFVENKGASMLYLTRRYEFSATHRLYNPAFTDEKNCEVFRECNNPNGHGHNYELEVTVKGEPDPETGMVVDMWALDQVVQEHLISKVDHKNMNLDVDFLAGQIPTAEVMVKAFWEQLLEHIPAPAILDCLRLLETRKNYAEYRGE